MELDGRIITDDERLVRERYTVLERYPALAGSSPQCLTRPAMAVKMSRCVEHGAVGVAQFDDARSARRARIQLQHVGLLRLIALEAW